MSGVLAEDGSQMPLVEPAVSRQQGAWCNEPVTAQCGGRGPGQCSQNRPVGPVQPGPGDLAARDLDLMVQHRDLGVLRRLAAAR
jgi:hypothetical protein